MMKNKKVSVLLFGASLAVSGLLFAACSVVFTSTLNGIVVDKDDYENGGSSIDPGINDVEMYLYFSDTDRDIDYDLWKEKDISPDDTKIKRYEVDTKTSIEPTTEKSGYFSFDSVAWNNLFPEYGNAEDVIEVFFLFQHESYGITKEKATITSDAENTIGPIVLERTEDREIRYGGQLNGLVFNDANSNLTYDTGEEVTGAEVKLYVKRDSAPESGATPDYAAYSITDADLGEGVFEISEIVWKDTMNAQRYSEITCFIEASTSTKNTRNALGAPLEFTMYSNTVNFVAIPMQ